MGTDYVSATSFTLETYTGDILHFHLSDLRVPCTRVRRKTKAKKNVLCYFVSQIVPFLALKCYGINIVQNGISGRKW